VGNKKEQQKEQRQKLKLPEKKQEQQKEQRQKLRLPEKKPEQQKEQRQKLRLPEKKQQKNKRQKGGDGSDFALTLSSRGPVNAPDAYWGVDGEKWFRQFNKSGDYIPNSQLAKAATPLLAGDNKGNIVVGFDEMGNDYGKVNF
jgi:hypothetical protein